MTQTISETIIFRSQCDTCESTGPLLEQAQRGLNCDTLCPACAAREALGDTTAANLHALMWPVIVQWAQFWQAAGVSVDQLESTLGLYGIYWHPHGAQGRQGGLDGRAVQDALSER